MERRRVGGAAGEEAGSVGGRQVEDVGREGAETGQPADERNRQGGGLCAAPTQAAEEGRPRRQAHRVGEQDQAELLEQREAARAERFVDRPDGETEEQCRRGTERHPFDPDRPDRRRNADDGEDQEDRVGGKDVDHGGGH